MESGIYTFLVSLQATKRQIAKSVENQFSVKVDKVNISKRPSKTRRVTRSKTTKTSPGKKALVYLASGQKIEMLSPTEKKESKGSKVSKASKDKIGQGTDSKEKKGLLSRIKK